MSKGKFEVIRTFKRNQFSFCWFHGPSNEEESFFSDSAGVIPSHLSMRPQVHHLTQLIIALFWNIYYLSCGCPDNPLPSIQLVAPPLIAGNYPIVDEIEGGVVELLWK